MRKLFIILGYFLLEGVYHLEKSAVENIENKEKIIFELKEKTVKIIEKKLKLDV